MGEGYLKEKAKYYKRQRKGQFKALSAKDLFTARPEDHVRLYRAMVREGVQIDAGARVIVTGYTKGHFDIMIEKSSVAELDNKSSMELYVAAQAHKKDGGSLVGVVETPPGLDGSFQISLFPLEEKTK